jgi:mRNA-degrading endonuclease HigB of HigAB toxin-antitoxin module
VAGGCRSLQHTDHPAAVGRPFLAAACFKQAFHGSTNKYRLVAMVNFEKQISLIERVLTHEECNREEF